MYPLHENSELQFLLRYFPFCLRSQSSLYFLPGFSFLSYVSLSLTSLKKLKNESCFTSTVTFLPPFFFFCFFFVGSHASFHSIYVDTVLSSIPLCFIIISFLISVPLKYPFGEKVKMRSKPSPFDSS